MIQTAMAPGPHLTDVAGWVRRTAATEARHRVAATITVLFRVPAPGDGTPDDIRRLLDEDEAVADAEQDRLPVKPEASLAAGLALCVPSLLLIGVLYSLLK